MQGRKPIPTALKILRGNPGKRPIPDDVQAPAGVPERPEHLTGEAQAEWDRITVELNLMGVLTLVDRAALAAYCQVWARWVDAETELQTTGLVVKMPPNGYQVPNPCLSIANKALVQMKSFLTEFGMTPSSRTRIHVQTPKNAEPDELDQFLN